MKKQFMLNLPLFKHFFDLHVLRSCEDFRTVSHRHIFDAFLDWARETKIIHFLRAIYQQQIVFTIHHLVKVKIRNCVIFEKESKVLFEKFNERKRIFVKKIDEFDWRVYEYLLICFWICVLILGLNWVIMLLDLMSLLLLSLVN